MTDAAAVSQFETMGFGKGPYRVIGYQKKVHQPQYEVARAGGTCDACGQAIMHSYQILSADGIKFSVGCECVRKVEPGLVRGCAIVRRDTERAARRAAQEAAERAENGGKTRAELWAEERARRAAEAAAERDAREARRAGSQWQGEVGKRYDLTLTIVGWYDCEPYNNGFEQVTTRLYFFEDAAGNQYTWATSGGIWQRDAEGRAVKNQRGQTFRVRGTVKKHDTYKDVKQTVLTRVQEAKKK